jgi:hypothetical protein
MMVLGPRLGTLVGTREPMPLCACGAHVVLPDGSEDSDRLRPGPYAQSVEDVRRMIANGLFADRQTLGDVDVAQPIGHEGQHLTLAYRQRRECRTTCRFLEVQKREHRLLKPLPCRLVLERT